MENEKRLIYADAFLKEADKALFMGFHAEERKRNFLDMISAMLDNCPTMEAVEVVHGRWILNHGEDGLYYDCSICGHCAGRGRKTNYCPNCGAKMDGGDEDG